MTLKVNLDALKAKLEGKKEGKGKADNKIFLKGTEAGVVKFRAMVYPHQEDPASNPFLDRYYHYGIAGEGMFYCPKLNDNQKCHVCEYIWEASKEMPKVTKEDKEARKAWFKKLPNGSVFIPGIVRGKEDEGPKFLKIGTRKDKMSENHEKVFKWFFDEDTADWLDPNNGFDIEIEYEEYDPGRSLALGGAKFGMKELKLARKSSKFGTKPSYDEAQKLIKNVDEIMGRKTTEDSLNLLKKWQAQDDLGFNEKQDVGTSVSKSSQPEEADVDEALKEAGL